MSLGFWMRAVLGMSFFITPMSVSSLLNWMFWNISSSSLSSSLVLFDLVFLGIRGDLNLVRRG